MVEQATAMNDDAAGGEGTTAHGAQSNIELMRGSGSALPVIKILAQNTKTITF